LKKKTILLLIKLNQIETIIIPYAKEETEPLTPATLCQSRKKRVSKNIILDISVKDYINS